jgi:hypothetical protein
VTAGVPSPKLNVYVAIGQASVSVDADASAVTVRFGIPELGVTLIRATGATSCPAWIAWLLTASTLPATSQDLNRTVVLELTVKGPVYVGLVRLGVLPLVV